MPNGTRQKRYVWRLPLTFSGVEASLYQRNLVTSRSDLAKDNCKNAFSMSANMIIGDRRARRKNATKTRQETWSLEKAVVEAPLFPVGFCRPIVNDANLGSGVA